MAVQRRVLVLDADMIACLSIVRSLAHHGIICDIAASTGLATLSQYSRYAGQLFRHPNPLSDADGFVDFIAGHLQRHTYDLVIPVTERSLIPLAHSTKMQPWVDILAIAPRDSLNKVLDKEQTMALAQQCGVAIPLSQAVDSVADIQRLLPGLSFPVVLKPGRSIPNADSRQQLSVAYAFNATELLELGAALLSHCQVLVQSYSPGIGTGIELLADHGEIVYAFQHQRLHEVPLTGGGSSFRKSILVDPDLLAAAARLIKALNWHGVAMVEFKWQPDTGAYTLMEINGRFWGSLPLACAAGADFPWLLYQLWVDGQRPATQTYRPAIYCRKLASDIYWYEQVFRRSEEPRLFAYPSTGQLLKDALWALHPSRHAFDVQQWRDPLPGLMDIVQIAQAYYQRVAGLLAQKWQVNKHRSAAMQNRLAQRLKQADKVLFVCYGNINRSAVAQVLAEHMLADAGIRFASAGFHPVAGRPADATMVKVAAEQGVDLSACRSKILDSTMLAEADVVFVMELAQLSRLQAAFPGTADKSFLLGTLNPAQALEIADPYNKAPTAYQHCFTVIKTALGCWAEGLRR
ncbi:ATP-grasp domain-containing protein [Methylovulum psychrotolerans]|uniref:arsenate reductase/protein-tyrosine-phosphatase family protein n=1 Tax=Methylovulum psychrotolerans TaxID=1704499 RepID=UPI001BFF54E6|nr:ATP-grasp domain-containing protein [Methylovulum psychrotolerans]MBT9099112.1 ATP-grasp domain-containing protein [Methylovulum psychrotolerans]